MEPVTGVADVPGRRAVRSTSTNFSVVPLSNFLSFYRVFFRLPPRGSGVFPCLACARHHWWRSEAREDRRHDIPPRSSAVGLLYALRHWKTNEYNPRNCRFSISFALIKASAENITISAMFSSLTPASGLCSNLFTI